MQHFKQLSQATQQRLFSLARPLNVQKGQSLQQPDQPWECAYWLRQGVVRMYYLDSEGQEHNKRFFLAGDFFWPVTSSLRTQAVGFAMEAIAPVTGQYWRFNELRSAFDNNEEWLEFNQLWMERLLEAKLTREREWLQLSASERYLQLLHQQPELVEQTPAHHIASYLGITPVSLSRLKKSLILNK